MDDFLYFFLRIRKQRIRMVVQGLRNRYPLDTREQLAERLISSCASLSFLGGGLFHLPALMPGASTLLKTLGFVAGASTLTRMNLYLILEIALLYEQDIDDQARVGEMAAVVAGTAAAVTAPHFLVEALGYAPVLSIPAAGLCASLVTRIIGLNAMRQYSEAPAEPVSRFAAR